MKVLVKTNNIVLLSWLQALLSAEMIQTYILDNHASIMEGSASAIPRRLAVNEIDFDSAKQILVDAGEGQFLE